MNIQTLSNLLIDLMDKHGKEVEVRIGEQIEAGPYLHNAVGGVWTNRDESCVIICAGDSDLWTDETVENDDELPLLWKPLE